MERLIEILKSFHPDVDYEECKSLIDDKIIDSYDIIAIIAEIYDEFDVVIPAEDIETNNFNSAEGIYRLICEQKDKQ